MNLELSDYNYMLSKQGRIVGRIDTILIEDMLTHITKYIGDDLKLVDRLILEVELKNESLVFLLKDITDNLLNNLIKKDAEAIIGFKFNNNLTEKQVTYKLIAII